MAQTDKEYEHKAQRRREHIATAAYYMAERRSFAPGAEVDDWLQAEREIDSQNGASGTLHEASQRRSPEETPPARQGPSAADAMITPDEVQEWAAKLGVGAELLRTAINKVGPDAAQVRKYLAPGDPPQGKPHSP